MMLRPLLMSVIAGGYGIMDIVLNHSYSQSPFVRLYNRGEWGLQQMKTHGITQNQTFPI